MQARHLDLALAGLASGVVALGAHEVRHRGLRPAEIRCFVAVNGCSERLRVPAWLLMQTGSVGGALALGVASTAAGHGPLGRRLATVGVLAWGSSKLIKPLARRDRPEALTPTHVRGRAQTGLGYPSGHAAVATALAIAVAPHVGAAWRGPLGLAALGVGATRVYVGAHLPLDVLGGFALGAATERAVRALRGPA